MSITSLLSLPLVLTSQLSQVPPNSNKAVDLLPTNSTPLINILKSSKKTDRQRQLSMPISKPVIIEIETVTRNDSIGSGLPKLPNGKPVVNDYGDTFSFGKQSITKDQNLGTQTVTGYKFQANSDAYTPTSPSNPSSQGAGINSDSSSITVFRGEINPSNNPTYNGINLTAIGTNPTARNVQGSFHSNLNSLGFNTNPTPPLFNKGNGPTGMSIGLEKGICSQDLSPNNSINLNVCAQGELGLSYLNNSVKPFTITSGSIRLGLGNEDTKIRPTPLGLSSDNKGWQIYTQATGNCNINDPKGVLNPDESTNSHCNLTASLGVQVPLGEQSQISLETKKNLAGTPSYNEHYNTNGLPVELRVKRKF